VDGVVEGDQALAAAGLALLQPFLRDGKVTEIYVDGTAPLYVMREGRLEDTAVHFDNDAQLLALIQSLLAPVGVQIGATRPSATIRLASGHLVTVVVPPLAAAGAGLVIRKPHDVPPSLQQGIPDGGMTAQIHRFLQGVIRAPIGIILAGNTNSDREIFLASLLQEVPPELRVITVEPVAEMRLQRKRLLRLQARSDVASSDAGSYSALLRLAQRAGGHRIVASNVPDDAMLTAVRLAAGGETVVMSMHAVSPHDALFRVEAALQASQPHLPALTLRKYVAGGIDLIVQRSMMADGVRRIVAISQVAGIERDEVLLEDLFVFRPTGYAGTRIHGVFEPTGVLPRFDNVLRAAGVELSSQIFKPGAEIDSF